MKIKYKDSIPLHYKQIPLSSSESYSPSSSNRGKKYRFTGKFEKQFSITHRIYVGVRSLFKTFLILPLFSHKLREDWQAFWQGKRNIILYTPRLSSTHQEQEREERKAPPSVSLDISASYSCQSIETTGNTVRTPYPSFAAYREEREADGKPVDLIVGRGTLLSKSYPVLKEKRYVFAAEETRNYHPFTIDTDSRPRPDYVADIENLQEMSYFPSNSVDDIYLERIFPHETLRSGHLFINAMRILKAHGTLVADFNDGSHIEVEREQQIEIMQETFDKFGVPLWVSLIPRKKHSRSNLEFDQFQCIKMDDFDPPSFPEPRIWAITRALREANVDKKLF
ncbi:hypothetical protein PHSC3_000324 [Chlamydiales bacterium STE3]|nr:hypothetical protein PHSC3_000324 [Chlamydiales bacterium STE3]